MPSNSCVCVSHCQSCQTRDPMDCSPQGSSVHGILQARILGWVAVPFSRGSSPPRVPTCVSCSGRWVLTTESPGKPPKNHSMRVQEESEKASLKLNIHKTQIMAPSPVTSWQIEGEKVEVVTDFLFLVFEITADGDCSHELRRRFLLARKNMTNLGNVLKSKDITLPTKVQVVKAMVFPVVMYGCES